MSQPQDPESQARAVCVHLARVGDRITSPADLERQLREAHEKIRADLEVEGNQENMILGFLRCGLELSHKAPVYATLLTLVCTSYTPGAAGFDGLMLNALVSTFQNVLREGSAPRCRRMTRFMAELTNSRFLSPRSFVAFLKKLLDLATNSQEQGRNKPHARKVFLADMALSCLPWCGETLNREVPELLSELMGLANAFHSLYLQDDWEFLRPASSSMSEDRCLLLINALNEMHASGSWTSPAILKPYNPFAQTLANVQSLDVPDINIPAHTKVTRYSPPEFFINFSLPTNDPTVETRKILSNNVDRVVISDYVTDILDNFHSNHNMCTEFLLSIPTSLSYRHRLVVTILSNMLRLPGSSFPLVYYGVVIAESCRVPNSQVPHPLLSGVNEFFENSHTFDPEVFDRFVEWFSYHLNNFGFQWNWLDWMEYASPEPESVTGDDEELKRSHAVSHRFKHLFAKSVIERCVRHSSYDFMMNQLPPEMRSLLPNKPEPHAEIVMDGLVESVKNTITGKSKLEMEQVKDELYKLTAGAEDKDRFVILIKAVLSGSCKTFSHFDIIAERYLPLIHTLSAASGEAGQREAVRAALALWAGVPQHTCYYLGRMMMMQIVSSVVVLQVLLQSSPSVLIFRNTVEATETWECVRTILSRAISAASLANARVTRAAYDASHATEGEEEQKIRDLEDAREQQKATAGHLEATVKVLVEHLLSMYLKSCELVALAETNGAAAEGTTSSTNSISHSTATSLSWRIHGMLLEVARKTPDACFNVLQTLSIDQNWTNHVKTLALLTRLQAISSSNVL